MWAALMACLECALWGVQAGDAVWEAEGVLPLTAMLDSQDPQQFTAAASAIAELANPENKAFQVSAASYIVLQAADP